MTKFERHIVVEGDCRLSTMGILDFRWCKYHNGGRAIALVRLLAVVIQGEAQVTMNDTRGRENERQN